jgi:hypothetical protein
VTHPGPGPKPDPPAGPHPTGPAGPGPSPTGPKHTLPQMYDQLTTVRNLLVTANYQLERECDPSSAPDDDEPVHQLIYAMAHDHIGEAWRLLGELAARFPDHHPAVPPDHRVKALPPSAAAGSPPACESLEDLRTLGAGASQRQVMPGTAELAASINAAVARRSR